MSLLVKGRSDGREIVAVTPRSAGWKYVGFAAYRLNPGESITVQQPQDELCLVLLAGTVTVKWRDQTWREIGGRNDVCELHSSLITACEARAHEPPG